MELKVHKRLLHYVYRVFRKSDATGNVVVQTQATCVLPSLVSKECTGVIELD